MNVATDFKYDTLHNYLVGERKNVCHTHAARPLLPGMSSNQVKEAWKKYLEMSGITDNPTIGNMSENVSYKKLMGWNTCPLLDDAAVNRHLLVMTVNEKTTASIRAGKCNKNSQAKQVKDFVNSICQHWTSSSVTKSVSDSGDIVLSSLTLHKACQNAGLTNATVGRASVAEQHPVQADTNDDKAATGRKTRTPPSTPTRSPGGRKRKPTSTSTRSSPRKK